MTEPTPVPNWLLERFRLGELSADQRARVSRAVANDAGTAERLAALGVDDDRTLAAHPSRVVAAAIRARLEHAAEARPARPRGLLAQALLPVLSAAAVTVGVSALLLPPAWHERAPEPATRLKGLEPGLLVFRSAPTGAEALAPATVARADDVVQIAYQAAGRRYGVVVSIDGRGRVTRHLPRTGEQAAPLRAGAPIPLPEAYRLDDAPGFERFFLVTSDASFSVELVVRATERLYGGNPDPARTGTHLDLPAGFGQARFELRKEVSR
jgi:hypothetical protein